jgi:hypothetical protein
MMVSATAVGLLTLSATLAHAEQQGRLKSCAMEWASTKNDSNTDSRAYRAFMEECLGPIQPAPRSVLTHPTSIPKSLDIARY